MEDFFSAALDLPRPWKVQRVELMEEKQLFEVHVTHSGRVKLACPSCGKTGPSCDSRPRKWRHLDACGYQTWPLCDVPRMTCSEHRVVQVSVPWAEVRSRFTAPFECVVIDWLHVAPLAAVARMMKLSWSATAGIQARAVERGLERHGPLGAIHLSVDETSFRKRHRYVTIVTDPKKPRVLQVATGRNTDSLEEYSETLSEDVGKHAIYKLRGHELLRTPQPARAVPCSSHRGLWTLEEMTMAERLTTEEVMTIRVLSKKGMPQRQIARELGVTEGAVRYHIKRGASGARDGRASKPKKADELAAEIEAWRTAHEDNARPINVKELYEHLEAEHGYAGSYKSVLRWVRSHWPKPKIRTYRRVETPPGAQTQTDWGHFKPLVFGQEEFAPMAFVMSLSHSRRTAVIWSRSRDQVHWLRCHNEAFLRLGGVPATNRVDNEKTAVCHGAGSWGRITPAYRAYADSMRFHVDACQPRQPQAKGKVENKVRLSRGLGPKRKAYDSLAELQEETDASFEHWAKKTICPVTGKLVWDTWQDELPFLQPLPETLPEPFDTIVQREVHRDCLVNFEGRQYAVPFQKVGLTVEVRGCADRVQVYHGGNFLIEYKRGTEARLLIDPTCFLGEGDDRVLAPQPLGKMGRRLEEICSMPVEQRPLDQYAALAEVAR